MLRYEPSFTRTPTRLPGAAVFAVIVLGAFALAGTADACPVCFQAKNDASRVAFIATTAFMTFLPLLVVGGGAWWVRRRFARAAVEERARDDHGEASPMPIKSLKFSA